MDYPIPETSLARIRQSYGAFEQLAQVVAEAMGIDVSKPYRIDLPTGKFVVEDPAIGNGQLDASAIAALAERPSDQPAF